MAESSYGVVVTEEMLTEAAKAGDLERLTIWAGQGVRIVTGRPLLYAIGGGQLEVVRLLVNELGADINQSPPSGVTPLMVAAWNGRLAVVQCLVELSAEIGAIDIFGDTAFLVSALNGRFKIVQYLLDEAGANMDDVNSDGENIWDMLMRHFEELEDDGEEDPDPMARTGLLRVLVLRGAPPPALVALLSPESARVVQEGARLRARLPAYLAHRRAYLDSRCPRISLLPGVLRALIYGFEGPATTEELWATGLGQAL
jgi:hypothetical protein